MIAAALHPNDIALELTGRDYVSWSSLSLYQSCPLRWWFRYVQGLPEETVASSLVFGGAIHRAIEFHYQRVMETGSPPDLELLVEAYREGWLSAADKDVAYSKDESFASLLTLSRRILATFQQSTLAMPAGRILGIEEELRGPIAGNMPDLLARIDLLFEDEQGPVMTDFKTSRSAWANGRAAESADQLLLYHELVSDLLGRPVRLQFAVLTKTKTPALGVHPVLADPALIERTRRIAQRVWRSIQAGHFYPSPSPLQCPSCPYRRQCRSWAG